MSLTLDTEKKKIQEAAHRSFQWSGHECERPWYAGMSGIRAKFYTSNERLSRGLTCEAMGCGADRIDVSVAEAGKWHGAT